MGLLFSYSGWSAGQVYYAELDLRSRWMFGTSVDNRFDPGTNELPGAVFFYIDPGVHRNKVLLIEGRSVESVFINGKLAGSGSTYSVALDDLPNLAESNVMVTVLFTPGEYDLVSAVLAMPGSEMENIERTHSALRDFVFAASLLLLVLWATLRTIQSKLTTDYLFFLRGFALRESEDSLQRNRMGGSGNVAFYLYAALMFSFLLLLSFQFSPETFSMAGKYKIQSVSDGFLHWSLLFTQVVLFIALKLVLVTVLGALFEIREFSIAQFFAFIQIILGLSSLCWVVMLTYFILRGAQPGPYSWLVHIVIAATAIWIVPLFIRLLSRRIAPTFYLFAYLCATEIIPLLITLGVVYKD